MFSRTERCSSEVSWVTTPICARSESCCTLATSTPSTQTLPASSTSWKRSSRLTSVGLAGAAAPDHADLLARRDVQVEVLDHPAALAVVERDVAEADLARAAAAPVRRAHRPPSAATRDRRDAVVHGADVLEQRRQLPHDPVRHAQQAQRQCQATATAPTLAWPCSHSQVPAHRPRTAGPCSARTAGCRRWSPTASAGTRWTGSLHRPRARRPARRECENSLTVAMLV